MTPADDWSAGFGLFNDSTGSKVITNSLTLHRVALLGLALMMGCAKPEPMPTTKQATITGTLSYEGKPVDMDSTVVFYCSEHDATLTGTVNSTGKFELVSNQKKVGIPVGKYKLSVMPPTQAGASSPVGSEGYTEMMKGGGANKPAPKVNLPSTVLNLQTSPFSYDVVEGKNHFDIDLSKAP